jgi:hypothetical protein
LLPRQIRGSIQASFAVFVGFTVSFAPAIPALIAQNRLEHISRGFGFPMILTFAAVVIFLFVASETARKPLENIFRQNRITTEPPTEPPNKRPIASAVVAGACVLESQSTQDFSLLRHRP